MKGTFIQNFFLGLLLVFTVNSFGQNEREEWLSQRLDIADNVYLNQGTIAAERYLQVLESSLAEGEDKLFKVLYARWGAILFNQRDFESAAVKFQQSLIHAKNIGDSLGMAGVYLNLGSVHIQMSQPEEGYKYYQLVEKIIDREDKTKPLVGSLYNNLGLVLMDSYQNVAESRVFLKQALEIMQSLKDTVHQANVEMNLAENYLYSNEAIQAWSYYKSSLEKIKHRENKVRPYFILEFHLTNYTMNGSQVSKAVLDSLDGLILADRDWGRYCQIHEKLSKYYKAQGLYKQALAHKEQVFIGYEEQEKTEEKIHTAQLREYHKVLNDENEAVLSSKEAQIVQQRKRMLIYLAFGAILLVVSVLLMLLVRRKKVHVKVLKEKLSLQEQKAEMADALGHKNRELMANATRLTEANQTMQQTIDRLKKLQLTTPGKAKTEKEINAIVQELKMELNSSTWDEFEQRFTSINSDFYKNLQNDFPNLTANEKRIAAFVKMELSSREISVLTKQSINSIDVAKSRLKKKLGLQADDQLSTFISNY